MFPNPIPNNYHTIEKPDISSFPFAPTSLYNDSLHNLFFSIPAASDGLQRPLHLQPPQPLTGGRRRQQRKDRHSKIYTAQGLRDRRMRLSLDVACKFFDLQDLLGFDRASKTVQWLLKKSKYAIKELMDGRCEEGISIIPKLKVERAAQTVIRTLRPRPSVQPKVARESREKARARARERTLEKKTMRMKCGRQEDGSQGNKEPFLQAIAFSGLNEECSLEQKSSLENCTTSPIHSYEAHHNGSTALFDYIQTVECLFQEPWETNFLEIYDERGVLVDLPSQVSYEKPLTPPVFDYV